MEPTTRTTKPLPPGNLGLPFLGETLALARSNHGFYKDRFAKYGPIFKTRLFGQNFVVVSGPEAFTQFVTDPAFERGGVDPISVRQVFFRSLAVTHGEEHRARKGAMLRAYDRAALTQYAPRMERIMQTYIDRWDTIDGPFAWVPDLQQMAGSLSGTLYTGDESDAHARELKKIVGWMRGAFSTLPLNVPGTPYHRAIRGRNRLLELIDEAIARHREGTYDDVLSRMLAAADDPDSGVSEDDVRRDLLHLLFASQGGFFVPISLMLMTLGERPDLMEQARAEVHEHVPDGPLTLERLVGLDYLGRLSRELRRYYAMNSATFFASVKKPVAVGDYEIPAGWGAIAGIHITMRNPDVFERPDEFDPDRFLPERFDQLAPNSYVPHGGGSPHGHKCPGEDIVTMAVKMIMILLLRQHTWTLPPQDLSLSNTLFPLPKDGLKVNLTRLSS